MNKEKIENIFEKEIKYIEWITWLLLILIFVCNSYILNRTDFIHDAGYYWVCADPIYDGHVLDFSKYPISYRGCIWPIILLLSRMLFRGSVWGYRLLAALMISSIYVFILPVLFCEKKICNLKMSMRTLMISVPMLYIWGDFIQYPISDLPSVFLLLAYVCICIKTTNLKIGVKFLLISFAQGMLAYATYNIRVVYGIGIAVATIIYVILIKKWRKIAVYIAMFSLGFFLSATPQIIINYYHTEKITISIDTSLFDQVERGKDDQSAHSLYNILTLGGYTLSSARALRHQVEGRSSLQLQSVMPAGVEILNREQINADNFNIRYIFGLIRRYPLDTLAIYVRHAISLMIPTFYETHIIDLHFKKGLFVSFSITVWIIAIIYFLVNLSFEKKGKSQTWLWFLPVLAPACFQMVGAPENRFILIVFLCVYYYVFCYIDYKKMWYEIKDKFLPILVVSIIIFSLCITVESDILSSDSIDVLLINEN